MLAFHEGTPARNCQGATRRAALKAGFLGLAGLTLPGLLRHRAEAGTASKDTAFWAVVLRFCEASTVCLAIVTESGARSAWGMSDAPTSSRPWAPSATVAVTSTPDHRCLRSSRLVTCGSIATALRPRRSSD